MIGGAVLPHAGDRGRHDDGPRREAPDPHRGRGRARRTARRARAGRGERGHTGPAAGRTGRENREGRRASSLVYIGEDGGGLSIESMFHNGILSVG